MEETYDFIIVGAGVAGCVLAARLQEMLPSSSILLLEAGDDTSKSEITQTVGNAFLAAGSEFDWKYEITPQIHLDGKPKMNSSGRGLSGGAAINVGGWTRGPASDYDHWAQILGDPQWSYQALLPYFCRSETDMNPRADLKLHGSDGPMQVQAAPDAGEDRKFPLFDEQLAAWGSLDLKWNDDINSGDQNGMGYIPQVWKDGMRQFPHLQYNLSGVHVSTGAWVHRVVLEERGGEQIATGIELLDGRSVRARNEVILCAGAFGTPKVLMLSGVGPASALRSHGITVKLDLPEVGENLQDHAYIRQVYKLRHPERGLAIGSPKLTTPALFKVVPNDFFIFDQCLRQDLSKALQMDGVEYIDSHPILDSGATHLEYALYYLPICPPDEAKAMKVAIDGSYLTCFLANLSCTSRGQVSLSSADPSKPPIINPNYCATEADRAVWRSGVRRVAQALLASESGRSFIQDEIPPPGFEALGPASSDDEIDARVRAHALSYNHPMGTAAMGKVVDSNLRVNGITGLRVVDASVFPAPIAAHTQAVVYAVAEKAADLIAKV